MARILIVLVIIAAVFAPSLWTKIILARNRKRRAQLGVTGAELARTLLDDAGLTEVAVEECAPDQDHYDPSSRTVRLGPEHFGERSLSAIVVAAHEVGHAIQHGEGYAPLMSRTKLAGVVAVTQKLGSALMWSIPIVGLFTRNPRIGLLTLVGGLFTLGIGALMHLVTLPVEFDASFKRALPLLHKKGYLTPDEAAPARSILKACAMTYVAAALANMLNVWRWLTFFRR